MNRLFKYLGYTLFLPIWWLQIFIPRNKSIWIIGSWYGERFSDNSKYLYQYVSDNHPETQIIWLTRSRQIKRIMEQKKRTCYMTNSFRAIYYSLASKYVIVSSGKKDINYFWINGAKWIQLWHGNPMKKIGLDDKFSSAHSFFQRRVVPVLFPFVSEFNYDFVVSNAAIFSDKMSSAFNIPLSQILETGCPRNDAFFIDQENLYNKSIRSKFNGCKIIYYLPTFRNHENPKTLFNTLDFDRDKVELFLEKENIVLINKGHFVDNKINNRDGERIINLSDDEVEDINILLRDADALITDYSGAYFDFLLTQKPIIFAAFDLKGYLESSREIYFDYKNVVAGPIVKDWNELTKAISEIWTNEYYGALRKEKNNLFNKYHDYNNSKRVFEKVKEL